jgi:hypothetical protein
MIYKRYSERYKRFFKSGNSSYDRLSTNFKYEFIKGQLLSRSGIDSVIYQYLIFKIYLDNDIRIFVK